MPGKNLDSTVNVCAAIRQGDEAAGGFFRRLGALAETRGRVGAITVVVDGDQVTDPVLLRAAEADPRVVFVTEGAPISQVETMSERSVGWARAVNLALTASLATPSDRTAWIEADLDFAPDLIDRLLAAGGEVVAPRVLCGDRFYDTWGFRTMDGRHIHLDAQLLALPRNGGLIELSSVGSCLLFPTEVLRRGARLPGAYPDGLLVGFCREARGLGYRVACAPEIVVRHPLAGWEKQVFRLRQVTLLDHQGALAGQLTGEDLVIAGPYAEFIAPAVRKLLRRRFLRARLGLLGTATFRFKAGPGATVEATVRLAGETPATPGFSRAYPVLTRSLSEGLSLLAERISVGFLKRFLRR